MAFSTQQGSGANDTTSFVGTTGVDSIVFEGNTQNFFVGANADNDLIGFDNVAFLTTGTYTSGVVKGGAGNDSINAFNGVQLVGTWVNGNGGDDIIGNVGANTMDILNSTVQGGAGEDTITVNAATGALINGNKDDDTIGLSGLVNSSTIGGGQGEDAIATAAGNVTSNSSFLLGIADDTFTDAAANLGAGNTIDGADGNDTITVASGNNVTVTGGDGVDTITTGAGDDNIDGGAGSDSITGGADNDTMAGGAGSNSFNYATAAESIGDTAGDINIGVVDQITDFTSGTDSITATAAGASINGGALAAAITAVSYQDALAQAVALGLAADRAVMASVGAAGSGSFSSYLFGRSNAGAAIDTVIQIGTDGGFATAALAQGAVVVTDLVG